MGILFNSDEDDRTVEQLLDDDATIEAKGDNGQVVSTPRKVAITFDGVLESMQNIGEGDVTLFYDSIRGIEFKKSGTFRRGYIELQQSGDENVTIKFQKNRNPDFEQVKELIEARMAAHR